jgi:KipI family sensor histidine kinase inhibitor
VRVLPYGSRAVLAEVDSLERVYGLVTTLRREALEGVTELIPAARTVLVRFDPDVISGPALETWLRRRRPRPLAWGSDRTVELPVVYDGPDLPEVAALTSLEPAEVMERHLKGHYVVAFCGFAPGFGYLVGGDPALRVPRRDTPRSQVPAGAVALAGEYTGVYPRAMPGGWQLIGRSEAALWDVQRDPPALLSPGTQVVFVPETAR